NGWSPPSFEPAMKPSSDIDSATITLATNLSSPLAPSHAFHPRRRSHRPIPDNTEQPPANCRQYNASSDVLDNTGPTPAGPPRIGSARIAARADGWLLA